MMLEGAALLVLDHPITITTDTPPLGNTLNSSHSRDYDDILDIYTTNSIKDHGSKTSAAAFLYNQQQQQEEDLLNS